jgi:hypothetical protein
VLQAGREYHCSRLHYASVILSMREVSDWLILGCMDSTSIESIFSQEKRTRLRLGNIDAVGERPTEQWTHHCYNIPRDIGDLRLCIIDREDEIGIGISDVVILAEERYTSIDILDIDIYFSFLFMLVFILPLCP